MADTDANDGDLNTDAHDPETGEVFPSTPLHDEGPDDTLDDGWMPSDGDDDGPLDSANDIDLDEGADLGTIDTTDTLMGDIRDAMLTRFRVQKKTWHMMVEDERNDLVSGMELAAKDIVRRVVRMVTDYPFQRCVVSLGEVKIGGQKGIEAKISAQNTTEARDVLGAHVGMMATLVMVDSAAFMGERAPVEVTPDQAPLPFGG